MAMNDREASAYVQASAAALGLSLDDACVQRVAMHLQRTAILADLLAQYPLTPHDEPAALYHPGPA